MEAEYKISQVINLTRSVMLDCYYIVSQSWPNEAEGVFYALQKNANNPGLVMFVASGKGGIIRGFIAGRMLDNNAGNAKIDWLFVEARHRRMGVGGMLVRSFIDYCKTHGMSRLSVQAARTAQASQFYAKHNFVSSDLIFWNKDLGR